MAVSPYTPKHKTPLHDAIANLDIAGATKFAYFRHIDRFVDALGPNPANWTRKNTLDFYANLRQETKIQSANVVMYSIRAAAKKWAEAEMDPNLAMFCEFRLHKPKEEAERNALTQEQALQLINSCSGSAPRDIRDRALFIFALETGARCITLCGSKWEKIASDPSYDFTYIDAPVKGKDSYKVPLTQTALDALETWRVWCKKHNITSGPIFRKLDRMNNLADTALTENGIWRIVKKRSQAIGLYMHPHIFRHTLITWRLRDGVDPATIMTQTAHKTMEMISRYADRLSLSEKAVVSSPPWLTALVDDYLKNT